MKKKLLVLAFCMTACVSLFGCGKNADEKGPEFVYVPTYQELSLLENVSLWNSQIIGNTLYYAEYIYDEQTGEGKQEFFAKDVLANAEPMSLNIQLSTENDEFSENSFTFGEDGALYAVGFVYPKVDGQTVYEGEIKMELRKYSAEGELLFAEDVTKQLTGDDGYAYVQYMKVDAAGRSYLSLETDVHVFDENGSYMGKVEVTQDWINGLYVVGDAVYAGRYSADYSGMELCEIDPQTKQVGNVLTGIPSNGNMVVAEGKDGEMLVSSENALFSYDLTTMEKTEILNWLNCDVPGYSVSAILYGGDDVYHAFTEDYSSEQQNYELITLTKTKASEVAQKEIITIASLYSYDQNLKREIIDYNKTNSEYRIQLKSYIDENAEWTDTTYSDAITRMNNDMTSGNAPDIIDLSYANMDNLIAKGLLEDWTPYLEKSTVISKDDFQEGILEAFTKDGKLYTIPGSVYVGGFMGKEEMLSDITSWTIEDMIALADAYPESTLFSYANKESVLQTFVYAAADTFIDYETGKCDFNGEDFIKLLEFANRFPLEYEYNEDDSYPTMLREGKIVLADVSFYSMEEFQMYQLLFDTDTRVLGYPSKEGDGKLQLIGADYYGICSKSDNKEGAFAFWEGLLAYEEYSQYGSVSGFPTRTDMLEECFAVAMEPNYALDENDQPMLDENGEPIKYPKTTWGWDDFEAEIYEASQEQVDEMRAMLNNCTLRSSADEELLKIISEETKPYFEGQKTAKEVADVIQSRVSIYVSENM